MSNKISQDLINHIEEANARIEEWIAADPANRWSTTFISPVEDPEFYLEVCDGSLADYLRWSAENDRLCAEKEERRAMYSYN